MAHPQVVFAKYQERLPVARSASAHISRDEAVVARYESDPLVYHLRYASAVTHLATNDPAGPENGLYVGSDVSITGP